MDDFPQALADAIQGPGIEQVPEQLCRACVDLLDVSGASVSLHGRDDARTLWWSSSPQAGQLAEAQYTLGDGPCQSAMTLAAPVLAADLTKGPDARQWPVFAQRAVELGVEAVFSLPLGSEANAIGTLDLYRGEPGPLSKRDLSYAFPAADAIAYALLVLQAGARAVDPTQVYSWLESAETNHDEVHQATGMVMIRLNLGAEQALARLRAHAFSHDQTLTQTARDVIRGSVTLYED
ncbi:GAF and ANTAR domain-containing protein [Streptomyces sp. 549]|uniref:GAF and ANTAR domain-containing protein n=1 Tax=Streptomyces sp. 549 TaxID=3049076 RepID=UPI0024C2A173|nr:GAF and ANTAR domain-containing protein [Streptomyces sp. 549]